MSKQYFIYNATIINEGLSTQGSLFIADGLIRQVFVDGQGPTPLPADCTVIDASGQWLLPGVIDTHVHFRQPGATHKADIASETRAALAGGVTSFMDMPNNTPPAISLESIEEKCRMAEKTSLINYSFYIGATNDNMTEIRRLNPKTVCGVKLFLGASTGNMLVDAPQALDALFAESPVLVAAHCEDETIIRQQAAYYASRYGNELTARFHPLIRTEEACLRSTEQALTRAARYQTSLHVLHVTTARELSLFPAGGQITAEACLPHLWFCDEDYDTLQNFVKCNPAIKTAGDRQALRTAVANGRITTIGSDHAPHTRAEKQQPYLMAPSGMPSLQYSLPLLLELCRKGIISRETLVERMCHAPARLFGIDRRGFIRQGYHADLVLLHPNKPWRISHETVRSKCGWTPYHGTKVHAQVSHTFVNGVPVYAHGHINDTPHGTRLLFAR
jgi:dihydroorotase